jgi:hypothetical protein
MQRTTLLAVATAALTIAWSVPASALTVPRKSPIAEASTVTSVGWRCGPGRHWTSRWGCVPN